MHDQTPQEQATPTGAASALDDGLGGRLIDMSNGLSSVIRRLPVVLVSTAIARKYALLAAQAAVDIENAEHRERWLKRQMLSAAELLERNGDEHGVGASLRLALKMTPNVEVRGPTAALSPEAPSRLTGWPATAHEERK